ncbi:hypothetical protein HSBGL_0243 [Halapricum desulfuricans]|uniref:Uncharacterized protein n=1 Tax=Halapricum desulfuricans TaxID=2841257 RepID=A0A897NDE7_9EURY|nr:hypothetical protein HSBGL_0243 [Halapricum desulfuricans]
MSTVPKTASNRREAAGTTTARWRRHYERTARAGLGVALAPVKVTRPDIEAEYERLKRA